MFLQLITEQASFTLPRSAEIEGKCGSTESEIHISWKNKAYTLRIYFVKVGELRQLDIFLTLFLRYNHNHAINVVTASIKPNIHVKNSSPVQMKTSFTLVVKSMQRKKNPV